MTHHPPEAVEAVARALWDENYPPPVHPGDMWQDRIKATALLDQIAPIYREQAARVADGYSGLSAAIIAAAIRKGE